MVVNSAQKTSAGCPPTVEYAKEVLSRMFWERYLSTTSRYIRLQQIWLRRFGWKPLPVFWHWIVIVLQSKNGWCGGRDQNVSGDFMLGVRIRRTWSWFLIHCSAHSIVHHIIRICVVSRFRLYINISITYLSINDDWLKPIQRLKQAQSQEHSLSRAVQDTTKIIRIQIDVYSNSSASFYQDSFVRLYIVKICGARNWREDMIVYQNTLLWFAYKLLSGERLFSWVQCRLRYGKEANIVSQATAGFQCENPFQICFVNVCRESDFRLILFYYNFWPFFGQ